MNVVRLTDTDVSGKRVLIREDLNVPIQGGAVTSDARIRAALPTIRYALERNAKVFILSHLGRPTEGRYDESLSLQPVAKFWTPLLIVLLAMAAPLLFLLLTARESVLVLVLVAISYTVATQVH